MQKVKIQILIKLKAWAKNWNVSEQALQDLLNYIVIVPEEQPQTEERQEETQFD